MSAQFEFSADVYKRQLLSYIPYLLGIHIVPIAYVALGLLALLLLVGKDLYGQIKAQESSL